MKPVILHNAIKLTLKGNAQTWISLEITRTAVSPGLDTLPFEDHENARVILAIFLFCHFFLLSFIMSLIQHIFSTCLRSISSYLKDPLRTALCHQRSKPDPEFQGAISVPVYAQTRSVENRVLWLPDLQRKNTTSTEVHPRKSKLQVKRDAR